MSRYEEAMVRVFDWCVRLLEAWASATGMTYKEVNVWVFCVIWPLVTVALVAIVLRQRRALRVLRQELGTAATGG